MKNEQKNQLDSLYGEFNVLQKKFMELRHTIESDAHETNLEKAKRLYPKGTKYRALEFKVGDWVKRVYEDVVYVFHVNKIKNTHLYLCDYFYESGNDKNLYLPDQEVSIIGRSYTDRLATNEEILEVLSWDAKRRGFVKGAKIKIKYEWEILSDPCFVYVNGNLRAYCDHVDENKRAWEKFLTIFSNNQWQFELINEEPFKIHGYEPRKRTFGFVIGDFYMRQDLLSEMNRYNNANPDHAIKTIILSNGKEITIEQIEKLIENLYQQCEVAGVPFFDKKNILGKDLYEFPSA